MLREGDELIREHQPSLRMTPTHERLHAVHGAIGEHVLRLVVDDELSVIDGVTQLPEEGEAFG